MNPTSSSTPFYKTAPTTLEGRPGRYSSQGSSAGYRNVNIGNSTATSKQSHETAGDEEVLASESDIAQSSGRIVADRVQTEFAR